MELSARLKDICLPDYYNGNSSSQLCLAFPVHHGMTVKEAKEALLDDLDSNDLVYFMNENKIVDDSEFYDEAKKELMAVFSGDDNAVFYENSDELDENGELIEDLESSFAYVTLTVIEA